LQNKVALVTGGGKKDVILCSENNYSKTSIWNIFEVVIKDRKLKILFLGQGIGRAFAHALGEAGASIVRSQHSKIHFFVVDPDLFGWTKGSCWSCCWTCQKRMQWIRKETNFINRYSSYHSMNNERSHSFEWKYRYCCGRQ
jgi:hypothetical protein